MNGKYYIELEDYEWRILISALNDFRNSLIHQDKSTDAVNEIMIKVIDTKPKRKWFAKG
ncbi:MAG: hypothetical protein IJE28_05710 [Oscillospiraceae bacterium]|nr:hypothetical protein [Oscillospiraceae bacterium]